MADKSIREMADKSIREQLAEALTSKDDARIKDLTLKLAKAEGAAAVKLPTVETAGVKTTARAHRWASGTRGYLASFKGEVNGERVQVNVNMFVVGSKGEAAK